MVENCLAVQGSLKLNPGYRELRGKRMPARSNALILVAIRSKHILDSTAKTNTPYFCLKPAVASNASACYRRLPYYLVWGNTATCF